MTNCSELIIFRIVDSQFQNTASILVLKEMNGDKHLPVFIGESETKAILLALEDAHIERPLTHDLFVNFMHTVRCSLKYVLVYRFFNDIYYARLYVLDEKGDEFFVESRLSDAVAIALRCKVPVYANDEVLEEAGISTSQLQNEDNIPNDQKGEPDIFDFDIEELEEMLQEAVENEDFERAALIRDEIRRRRDKK
jgi:bifunctional DNase/RNase